MLESSNTIKTASRHGSVREAPSNLKYIPSNAPSVMGWWCCGLRQCGNWPVWSTARCHGFTCRVVHGQEQMQMPQTTVTDKQAVVLIPESEPEERRAQQRARPQPQLPKPLELRLEGAISPWFFSHPRTLTASLSWGGTLLHPFSRSVLPRPGRGFLRPLQSGGGHRPPCICCPPSWWREETSPHRLPVTRFLQRTGTGRSERPRPRQRSRPAVPGACSPRSRTEGGREGRRRAPPPGRASAAHPAPASAPPRRSTNMPAVDKLLLEEALQDSPQVAAAAGTARPSVGRSVWRTERSGPAGPGRAGSWRGPGSSVPWRGQGDGAVRGQWVRVSPALGAVGERGCAEAGTRGRSGVPRGVRRGKSRHSLLLGVSREEGCPPARGALCPLSSPPSEKLAWRFHRAVPSTRVCARWL